MINFPDLDKLNSSPDGQQIREEVMPFSNLASAGRELAAKLGKYRQAENIIVLAIMSGGLPVAYEVANFLGAPLDLLIIRRLLAPDGPGSQLCAVSIAGTMVVDPNLPKRPADPSTPIDHFMEQAIAELGRREQQCRRRRPPIDLRSKIVILVDCGIRTGSTMQAAIAALRTLHPAQIIAAVPVSSNDGHSAVTAIADEVVCLARPQSFGHVGMWYRDFSRPGDDEVSQLFEA
jgi:predicted phosphoribosyltransferase